MDRYDLIVIGGGPGGYPAAIRAAQRGAAVALVEREALGGTCLNWGCIPTKTLLSAAAFVDRLRHPPPGVLPGAADCEYAAMVANKNRVVATLRTGVAALLKAHGVTVLEGTATFRARTRLSVGRDGAEIARLEAGRIVIATGSTAALPHGLALGPAVVDSRGFLDRDRLPDRLLVLGGGVIGCELACLAAQLGARVTVVELLEDIVATLDRDLRQELRRAMERDLHIRVLTGQPLDAVTAGPNGVQGRVGTETIAADLLLAAAGRRPVSDGLDLQAAGLSPNARGYLDADACGQTAVPGLFAVGDITGGLLLAHAATAQGLRAADTALGHRVPPAAPVIPACLFTAPEIATVGLSETEARQRRRAVRIGKFPFLALGKALAAGEPAGFVKWIADAETDHLLGAAAVGAHATELIATATTAVQAELTAAEFARTVQAHPTLSEAWMEAAHAVHGQCIHAPPARRKPPQGETPDAGRQTPDAGPAQAGKRRTAGGKP